MMILCTLIFISNGSSTLTIENVIDQLFTNIHSNIVGNNRKSENNLIIWFNYKLVSVILI